MNNPATYGDSEVRGRLRQWKSKLVAGYDRLDRPVATNALDSDTIAFCRRNPWRWPVTRLRQGVQEARCDRCGAGERQQTGRAPIAVWAILKPRISVAIAPDDPADGQNCVAVNYSAPTLQIQRPGAGVYSQPRQSRPVGCPSSGRGR